MLLIEFERDVSRLEWFLFAFVVSQGFEHFRKLAILEASSLLEKVRVFYNRYWNLLTTSKAVILLLLRASSVFLCECNA